MKRRLKITVLMDEECVRTDDPLFLCRGNSVEYHVISALRSLGHTVCILKAGDDTESLVHGLSEQSPDVVFNLTEQFRDQRKLDANVAGLLQMMDIPFTGSGLQGLLLCRNKSLCNKVLYASKIDVPRQTVIPPGAKIPGNSEQLFPLIVKPALEDGSDGISGKSVVFCRQELKRRCLYVHRRFLQPAIVEEFVDGRELYVAMAGGSSPVVFPARELFFAKKAGSPVIATARIKWDIPYRKKCGMRYGFARLSGSQKQEVSDICKRAYCVLGVRGCVRFDLRMNITTGRICIIEVNPNPNLSRKDDVAFSAARAGISYTGLIELVVRSAVKTPFLEGFR